MRIDGLDVRHISLASLGREIGVVTQETYLFHDTVIANLRYATRRDAGRDRGRRGAAAIHQRINAARRVRDHLVGERGYSFGGEKQRVAIARVLLKDPRILILVGALDTVSERLIQRARWPA